MPIRVLVYVENAVAFINGIELANGQNMNIDVVEPFIIKVVANEGYWFFDYELEAGIIARNDWNSVVPVASNITITNPSFEGNWSEDYKEFIFEWSPPENVTIASIQIGGGFNAIEGGVEPEPPEAPDLIDTLSAVYHSTIEEIRSLADERYVSGMDNVPIRNYIYNLYTMPFNVSELDGEKQKIALGGSDLETESTILTQSILNVLVAEILVPAKYGNAYDYIKTTCTLHLPFIGSMELDVNRVVGKTITVKYVIDLYDGIATCNVYSEGELLTSKLNEVGRKAPFYQKTEVSSETPQIGKILNNSVIVPFIEVVRNIPYDSVEGMGSEISQVEVIGNLEGYVELSTVHLQTSASKREQEMITSQLRNGVIIQ